MGGASQRGSFSAGVGEAICGAERAAMAAMVAGGSEHRRLAAALVSSKGSQSGAERSGATPAMK